MTNSYAAATLSFREMLSRLESEGRKDSQDWYLANGLLQLAQGLQQVHEEDEDRMKGYVRSAPAHTSHK